MTARKLKGEGGRRGARLSIVAAERAGQLTAVLTALASWLVVCLPILDALGWLQSVGPAYCAARHPVETLTADRAACERQHIIQPRDGGNDLNVVWINAAEHEYLNLSRDRPWQEASKGMWGEWGDHNLRQAYKLGIYANGYHFVVYDYGSPGQGDLTLYAWDGASHFTYMIASLFNFITKELSYLGYQLERDETQWLDAVLGIVIDFVEVSAGIEYGVAGIFIGTIVNPIDTFGNLPGMVVLSVEAVAVGVWNTVADILSIVSLGSIQVQTARW